MNKPADIDPDFLKIDPLRLDKEWVQQPELYFQWAARLAEARTALDDANNFLNVEKCELDAYIRANPAKVGLEKVTETAIAAMIPTLDRYQKAQAKVRDAQREVNMVQAAVIALEHRKRALTMLVNLHTSNYFAEPALPKDEDARGKVQDVTKRASRTRTIGALADKTKKELLREDDETPEES